MIDSQQLLLWIKEFMVNRTDTYALQMPDGRYVRVDKELTDDIILKHLNGEITVGIYQISKDNMVKWGCIDFDDEPAEVVRKVFEYLQGTRLKDSLMLEYTGGRGYHIWVFVEPVKPWVIRNLLKEILMKLNINVEIFPKQDSIDDNGFGNLVKLPFGIHRKTGGKSLILYPDDITSIKRTVIPKEIQDSLLSSEEWSLTQGKVIVRAGWWHKCPAYKKIRKGVPEGMRNVSAFFLARVYRDMGLTKAETAILLRRWNKRNQPPLNERELKAVIKSAYSRNYMVGFRSIAMNELLSQYCPDSCMNCPYRQFRQAVINKIRDLLKSKL